MSPIKRLVRYLTGWLAIPASLFLMTIIGCQTAQPSAVADTATATHSHDGRLVEGSPFEKVFDGQADFVVLTFFDLYCVACQQSAENFRILNQRVQSDLADIKVQMTGIGIGDTEFELGVFDRKYQLGYRCIADPEKSFETPFAIRGTPTILLFERKGTDCLEIYRHEGRFRMDDMDALIAELRQHIKN